MPDDFQQSKGLLGQEIAKLHLQRIKCWPIADEEVEVEAVDSRARLDIVAQRDREAFSPIEVKFQEYSFERYGVAFEHVLNEFGNGRDVYAIHRNANRLKLSQPVLYLWFPPSLKIREKVPFYSTTTFIVFEDAIQELWDSLEDSYIETIGSSAKGKVERFLRTRGCALSPNQRRALGELFPCR
jgi:hypothetical protein